MDSVHGNFRMTPLTVGAKATHGVCILDSSGNIVSSFGGSGGTAQADNSAFTAGSGQLTPIGALYEASPSTVTTGRIAAPAILANRQLKVTLYDSAGLELAVGGGIQYTDGDLDSTPSGNVILYRNASDNKVYAAATDKPLPVVQTGTPGLPTGASTLAEQQSQTAVLGATTGAKVITDANGTIQQYLRGLVYLAITAGGWLVTATIAAGTAIIGKVGIDQTTPGTTDSVTVATAQGAGAAIGATTGAKVITDANGTIQQYLRGLIYQSITAGAFLVTATIAAGSALIGNVGHGKTIKTVSGTFTSDTDVVAAVGGKRIKVIAVSLFTFGTSATTVIWKSNGTGGTELSRDCLQSIASQVFGIKVALSCPSFLFATVSGEKLTADTNTGDTIHYTLTYFDDDAA